MTTSLLLKFARAKDDADFVWRISAAMSVHAQEIASWDLTPASRALAAWVQDNPMVSLPLMVNHVSTNTSIAANILIENGAVDTSGVPDTDLQYVVNDKWDTVANKLYPNAV